MVEKIILDRELIYQICRRKDNILVITYNKKNKRAWFITETMTKRKPIALDRVIELERGIQFNY